MIASAKGGAKLVLGVVGFLPLYLEIGGGIEERVPQVFPHAAVELVGSRLQGDVDHRASRLSELGGERAGLDLEFLHAVEDRLDGLCGRAVEPDDLVFVIDSIE
jgi:hypothetical protein